MGLTYVFLASLIGLVILLTLKSWELRRGAKPFSVLRYRLDILMRRKTDNLKEYAKYISWTTFRLALAFLVAKTTDVFSFFWKKWTDSRIFKLIKGNVIPKATGPVSAFLKDVADFKSSSNAGSVEIKDEIGSEVEKNNKVVSEE